MFSRKQAVLETVIGSDSTMKGELRTKGTVRIDGDFEGNIRADWMVIGETGMVRGDLTVRGMVIGGKAEGIIRSTEIVEIKPKGVVVGEVYCAKLTISEGAVFEGRSHMQRTREVERQSVLPLIPPEK